MMGLNDRLPLDQQVSAILAELEEAKNEIASLRAALKAIQRQTGATIPEIKAWSCVRSGHLTYAEHCPDVCSECKKELGGLWLSLFNEVTGRKLIHIPVGSKDDRDKLHREWVDSLLRFSLDDDHDWPF